MIVKTSRRFVASSSQYPGETELEDEHHSYSNALWIDMPIFSRFLHVLKQVPCYFLLFLYPFFYPCIFPDKTKQANPVMIPWFCKGGPINYVTILGKLVKNG